MTFSWNLLTLCIQRCDKWFFWLPACRSIISTSRISRKRWRRQPNQHKLSGRKYRLSGTGTLCYWPEQGTEIVCLLHAPYLPLLALLEPVAPFKHCSSFNTLLFLTYSCLVESRSSIQTSFNTITVLSLQGAVWRDKIMTYKECTKLNVCKTHTVLN